MTDDHNERPVSAREYRWLHAEVLRLAGRVSVLEDALVGLRDDVVVPMIEAGERQGPASEKGKER